MLERKDIHLEAIFKHMIPGDEALLQMSAAHYKRLAIGGEIYPYPAESIEHLRRMLPTESCCTAHLAHSYSVNVNKRRGAADKCNKNNASHFCIS